MNPWIQVILLSILPVVELRGSIPLAFYHNLNPYLAASVAVISNCLAAPLTFFFLDLIHHRMMRWGFYKTTFDAFMERTQKKAHSTLERYGYLGLAIFVGIPLPGTGAYTGALAAWFFGMDKHKAFWAISLGVLIAGIIVLAVMLTGSTAWSIFVKA